MDPEQVTPGDAGTPQQDGGGTTPWDKWITENEIPDIARPYVERAFKHNEALVTPRFQEAAEYRKSWEPYENIINREQWQPEDLQHGLAILEALEDDGRRDDILRAMIDHFGVELGDGDELDLDDDEDPDPVSAFEEVLDQRLSPLQEFIEKQQRAEQEKQAQDYIESSLASVSKDLGRDLSEQESTQLLQQAHVLAQAGEKDPIGKAWEAVKAQRISIEEGAFQAKRNEPGKPESGPSRPPLNPPKRGSTDEEKLRGWMASHA